MEKFSEELSFTPTVNNHSTVTYRSIAPQSSTSVTLSATSVIGPTEIIISPSVLNFSKSRLNFNLRIPQAAEKAYTWINANLLTLISRVVLYDSVTNATLCDIGSFEKYASMVLPAGTHIDDLLSKPFVSGTPAVTEVLANPRVVEDISKSCLANNYSANGDIGAFCPYTGRRQFYISAIGDAGGTGGDAYLNVSLPLEAFKMSILSSNRLQYFPSNLVLQIYWNAGSNFMSSATSATDPTTGAAVCAVAPIISNLNLTLATEANLQIVSQIIDKVMKEGMSMPIAYPSVSRNTQAASTSHSYSIQLTKAYGNRVLAMITAPFSSAGITTQNLHSRGTLTVYNTTLNNVAILYPAGLDASKSQDWYLGNKHYLEKSALQSIGEYYTTEWIHVDGFCGSKGLWEYDQDQHNVDGLAVDQQASTWTFSTTLSAGTAYNYVTVIIGQKMLTVNSSGSYVS